MKTPSLPQRIIREAMRTALVVFASGRIKRKAREKVEWATALPADPGALARQCWVIVQPLNLNGYPVKMAYRHGETKIEPHLEVKGYAVTEEEAEQKLDVIFLMWSVKHKPNN